MELLSRWTVFPNLEIFLFEICFLSCRGCGRTVAPLQPWLGNVTQDTLIERHNDRQTHAPIHKTIQRLWPVEAFSPVSSSSQTWYLSQKNSSFEAKQLRQKVLNWHICVAWSSLTIICCQHGHCKVCCHSWMQFLHIQRGWRWLPSFHQCCSTYQGRRSGGWAHPLSENWFVINESLMLCHQKTIWSRLNFFYIQTIFFASSVRDIRPLLWWEVGPQRREIQRLCQHHRVWKNLPGINKGEIWGTMNCLAGLGCNIASHALGPNRVA